MEVIIKVQTFSTILNYTKKYQIQTKQLQQRRNIVASVERLDFYLFIYFAECAKQNPKKQKNVGHYNKIASWHDIKPCFVSFSQQAVNFWNIS